MRNEIATEDSFAENTLILVSTWVIGLVLLNGIMELIPLLGTMIEFLPQGISPK